MWGAVRVLRARMTVSHLRSWRVGRARKPLDRTRKHGSAPFPFLPGQCSLHPMQRWPLTLIVLMTFVLGACSSDDVPPPPLPGSSASVGRGAQLAGGFAACGFCHSLQGKPGAPLSGGRTMSDMFGEVVGPNITVSPAGIGTWSESDVRTLLRANKRPDETYLYSWFHKGNEWMSDADLTALIAFLRSLPPVENVVERRDITWIERNTTGFFTAAAEVKGYVPQISPRFRLQYGEYLTNSVAGCDRCHATPGGTFGSSEYLAGGAEIVFDGETKTAPNITQSKGAGIGNWSEGDLTRYLRTGVTPAGREVDKRFCPVEFYQRATPEEIDSVVAYLRSVPVVEEPQS